MASAGLAYAQSANYQGLWWNWPPESESGWGINLAHQGDKIFATWFTYDASGKGWWLSMTAEKTADRTYAGTLIETKGPAFSAVPFDPTKVTRTAVGNGTLTFTNNDNGVLSYTVKGVQQTKSITRQVFDLLPTCTYGARPNFAAATNYQDLWWIANGAESGWGINLTHQGEHIFATWFTYDVDGTPLWLSVTAEKVASRVYSGDLIRTTGPAFNAVPFNPSLVTRTVVGRATFTFADGSAAAFSYTVNGISQTKTITRQLFVPPAGTMCTFDTFSGLTFDKISLATFPGAQESITVTAKDPNGNPLDWEFRADSPGVVGLVRSGSRITITGLGVGRTQLTVRTSSGVERSIPVRVYDPRVLGVGVRNEVTGEIPEEIQIKYVDQFACRWTDAHAGADIHASFYHPVNLDGGWRALGSLGVDDALECPSVDGKQWMLVVRTNPDVAVPGRLPPLKPPVRFEKEWDDAGTGGDVMFGAFWTPICDAGYVAMGTVVTGGWTSAGRNPPALTDATCVRSDLTVPAQAAGMIWYDKGTGGDVKFQGSFSMQAPSNSVFSETTAYLTTGTFVTRGQLRSCPSNPASCWATPAPGSHAVMNMLAVDLPMLIDTPPTSRYPSLTGYDPPPPETEPTMTKAMLVPFTAVGSGSEYGSRTLHWMVTYSPFVRAERVLRWTLLEGMHMYNTTSTMQHMSTTFTQGITKENSTTISHTAGIELTAEGGVKFLGTGGSISATVSYQFGYETQTSVADFSSTARTVSMDVLPGKAAAAWIAKSNIVVKLHNLSTNQLEGVASIDMGDAVSHHIDEYPD